MQLSANTQVKTIEGHYTGHFKAVVTKPQNVYVMRDVAAAGYVAGGNCLFFSRNPGKPLSDPDSHTTAACREALQTRLSFSNDVGAKYASMLAFPMFESQLDDPTTCLDTTMSVTSRLLPWEVAGTVSNGTHTSFPGGEEAFKIYNAQLGLRSIHFGEDMKAAENQDFISQARVQNPFSKLAPSKLTHCVLVCTGFDQQCSLLPWSASQVRLLHRKLLLAHARPRPLGPGRDPWRCEVATRRVRFAQGGAEQHGVARDCGARADGLQQEVGTRLSTGLGGIMHTSHTTKPRTKPRREGPRRFRS